MNKLLAVMIVFLMSSTAFSQDWVDQDGDGIEFNCEVLNKIVATYSDEDFLRSDGTVSTVADFVSFFCPITTETASIETNDAAPENTVTTETSDSDYSFNSADEGLQPVLGPIFLPAGIYIFTVTTDGYMFVSPTSLSGACEFDFGLLSTIIIRPGQGTHGAQSVVTVESDCNVLLEISNTTEEWTLDIEKAS